MTEPTSHTIPRIKAKPDDDNLVHRTLLQDIFLRFLHHRVGMIGASIILLLIILAIFGSSLAPYEPNEMDFVNPPFSPPTLQHPFGTDDFGRDILSRIMVGARVSVMVGIVSVSLAASVGTILGMIAGYGSRLWDEIIMRSMDVLLAFPTILLALAVMAILGKGVNNAMVAIGIVYIPIFARIARSSVLSVKTEEFVLAARALGAGDLHILVRHIFPNILSPIIVETSLSLSFAILAEAALSFFGLGTQPPDPSWGSMLSFGRQWVREAPWFSFFPGLAIFVTVLSFNLVGDGWRDALDPRL
ncbi:MAG: ABC transporter permease [Anaerolineae bacterium]|nr:ABC transporter permease [Anaerolineae bacterium]